MSAIKMIKLLRRTFIVGFLILSVSINAAIVASEAAYNIAYGLLSNAISIIYDTAELSSSIGWKKAQLKEEFVVVKTKTENDRVLIKDMKSKIGHLQKTILDKDEILVKKSGEIKTLNDTLSRTSNDLKSAERKLLEISETNGTLTKSLSKSSDEISALTQKNLSQANEIKATKKIIQDTTDRTSKRIATRVARNIAAMPFESVPVAGVAITVGTIYLEIQDACQTLKEFEEMKSSLGLDTDIDKTDRSYCSLTKDDLSRLIANRSSDFEECVSVNSLSEKTDISEITDCLPDQVGELSIPEFEEFDKPSEAEL